MLIGKLLKQGDKRHREIIGNLLRVRFGELDESLAQVVTTLVGMPSAEFMPLLIQLSREELLDRFTQK